MKKPNFFIVGAPKCGTTSLAAWLADHREVFISSAKEPHFFNTDHRMAFNSLASYERLFEQATERHVAVGEASVWYLYSSDAVANILDYNPDARFIVMLRNPADMAPSLHEELVFTGREDVEEFSLAWRLQQRRQLGENLPRMVGEPKFLQYGAICSLGAQLDRLYQRVPQERVKVILLEDVMRDSRRAYLSILNFLGVGDDRRSEFPILNRAKTRRWPGLLPVAWITVRAKKALGIEKGLGLWTRVDALNRVERSRRSIDTAAASMLRNYFSSDVERLQQLIGRNLDHWLS
jgi:hypothetical protein